MRLPHLMKRIIFSTWICTELVAIFHVPPYQHLGLYWVSLYVFLWLVHQQLVMVLQITDLPSDKSSIFRAYNEFGNFLKTISPHGQVQFSLCPGLLSWTSCLVKARLTTYAMLQSLKGQVLVVYIINIEAIIKGCHFPAEWLYIQKIICWDEAFSFSYQPKQAYTNIIYSKHLPL